jgi:hypothetical protein
LPDPDWFIFLIRQFLLLFETKRFSYDIAELYHFLSFLNLNSCRAKPTSHWKFYVHFNALFNCQFLTCQAFFKTCQGGGGGKSEVKEETQF